MEMAQYIVNILRSQLSIMLSWGFRNPIAIDNGVYFRVDGFKHTGWVLVRYDEGADLFVVELYDIYQRKTKTVEDVYIEELVGIIDNLVERTEDYEKRVREKYSLLI